MAIPFVQAKFYTATNGRQIDLIVIHDMQAPETGSSAEDCANFFATMPGRTQAQGASAHYCVDADSTVQCVHDMDVAWHAPGANRQGIGIEQPGWANFATNEWLDTYGHAMIQRVAALTRTLCDRYGIPIVFLRAADLSAGKRGITTHYECSQAWGGDHWDPGPGYPMLPYFISLVRGAPSAVPPSTPRPKGVAVFDPPLSFRAFLARPAGGAWVLFPDGGIGALGAPDRGNVHGQGYFQGFTADHLEFPSTPAELQTAAGRGWGPQDCHVTVATTGQRYGPVYS
jgi:N-acetylmuramoyl-L-alanine amidase